jgi:transposase-like protein
MIIYPTSELEFDEAFKDEAACMEYIISVRWPGGPCCPECGYDKLWRLDDGKILKCSACGQRVRPLSGTIFQDTHLPVKIWLKVMWHIMSQKYGTNATGLTRTLGLSYTAAWNVLHKLRRCMIRAEREKLSPTVEVDEAFIGGLEEGIPGRGAEKKSLIVLAVELSADFRKLGRVRMATIPDASGSSLIPFLQKNVSPGATVVTDGWRGYSSLEKEGFKHIVNLKSKDDDLLPHVHTVISLIKRWLLGTYQGGIYQKHLGYYLDEYTFRFNRRKSKSRGKLFRRLIEQAVITPPLTRKELKVQEISEPKTSQVTLV